MSVLKDMFAVGGKISYTKLWGTVASASASVLALQAAGVQLPHYVVIAAAIIGAISGKLTIDGARNAVEKVAPNNAKIMEVSALIGKAESIVAGLKVNAPVQAGVLTIEQALAAKTDMKAYVQAKPLVVPALTLGVNASDVGAEPVVATAPTAQPTGYPLPH